MSVPSTTPGRRPSQRRQRTRGAVIAAAARLFADRGYRATTMADIAAAASVSVQTLYLAFGAKVDILAAVHDTAIAGDDEPVPLLEREWAQRVRDEADGRRALAMLVGEIRRGAERVLDVYAVIQSAADDPDVGELYETLRRQRHETWRSLASDLATKRGFSGTSQQAADLVYTVASVEVFRLLVAECGWSWDDASAWMLNTLSANLFPKSAPGRRRP